jgi:hypothetical protein
MGSTRTVVLAVLGSAVGVGAAFWASDALDDYAGWALALAASHAGYFFGLHGAADGDGLSGSRRAIVAASVAPTMLGPLFALVPWLGLDALSGVILYLLVGAPLAFAFAFAALFRLTRGTALVAARRVMAFVAASAMATWALAGGHVLRAHVEGDAALELLVGALLLTAWLVVPALVRTGR